MAKEKTLQKYLDRIEAAEKHRSTYEKLWKDCYQRWRSYPDPILDPETGKEDLYRSNIFIPATFQQVETVAPRIVETLFAARPYVAVKGRTPDDVEKARKNEILLDYQMNERMSFQKLFHYGIKGLCIYGTAIAYIGWKYEEKEIIRKELLPATMPDDLGNEIQITDEFGVPVTEYQPVKVNDIVYDDPEVKFIDLGLFFVDPAAEDIEDARYCGHIEYLTRDQLKEREALGLYKIDWKKIGKSSNEVNKFKNERLSEVALPTIDDIDETTGFYEVLHYWEDDRHAVIINRMHIAADGPNPYWHKQKPYKRGVYCAVPGEFYGMGIPEMIWDLQDELNTERNMRIDYKAFLLRRMFKVRRNSVINKKQLKWRQGGIIEVEDMGDVEELGAKDTSASSFTEETTIKDDIQRTTGGHDIIQGISETNETATTTMTKSNNASLRFKLIISSVENDLLVPIARQMLQLNQQYLTGEKMLRITQMDEDQYTIITEEEIQGEFDLIAAGSNVEATANKEATKQRLVELYGLIRSDPLLTNFPDKHRNFLKTIFQAFEIKNYEELLPSDQDLQMLGQSQVTISPAGLAQITGTPRTPGFPIAPENTALMKEGGITG